MKRLGATVVLACALASAADADEYRLVEGAIVDPQTGEETPLSGSFLAGPTLTRVGSEPIIGTTDPNHLFIPSFRLVAGDRVFEPQHELIDFGNGALVAPAVFLVLHVSLDRDPPFRLPTGSRVVDSQDDRIHTRGYEFVGDGLEELGERLASGQLSRFAVEGTLLQVDQEVRLIDQPCPIQPLPPLFPGGDGTLITHDGTLTSDGGNLFHSFQRFDVAEGEEVRFQAPDPGVVLRRDVVVAPSPGTGGISLGAITSVGGGAITGRVSASSISLLNPQPLLLGPTVSVGSDLELVAVASPQLPPGEDEVVVPFSAGDLTLEALGITAPDGATLSVGEDGGVEVTSEGDLFLGDVDLEALGIPSLRIETSGSLLVEGTILVGSGDLQLVASTVELRGNIEGEGSIEIGDPGTLPPGDIIIDPPEFDCRRPVFTRTETPAGEFHFVAGAVQPVQVALRPRGRMLRAAILGSEALDVRDVDADSLRLGPGRAEPAPGGRAWRRDVDRDGHPDLVARFRTAEARIEAHDALLCLSADSLRGPLLEGCADFGVSTGPTPKLGNIPAPGEDSKPGKGKGRGRGRR